MEARGTEFDSQSRHPNGMWESWRKRVQEQAWRPRHLVLTAVTDAIGDAESIVKLGSGAKLEARSIDFGSSPEGEL